MEYCGRGVGRRLAVNVNRWVSHTLSCTMRLPRNEACLTASFWGRFKRQDTLVESSVDGFSDAVSITAISTKHKSDEHLLLLHRRLRRESGHLTKREEPRLETALVLLFYTMTYWVCLGVLIHIWKVFWKLLMKSEMLNTLPWSAVVYVSSQSKSA